MKEREKRGGEGERKEKRARAQLIALPGLGPSFAWFGSVWLHSCHAHCNCLVCLSTWTRVEWDASL